jgi:VWFA-related protein
LISILHVCFFVAVAQSQQSKQPPASDQDEIVTVDSHLVNLEVIAKDKKGKAITDLKAEDFAVFENGVQQKIEFFDQTLNSSSESRQSTAVTAQLVSVSRNKFPRNIIALVLDGQTTEGANLKYVRDGMINYIRERITDSDSVAIFSISGGLQLLQPFTQDKTKLVSAVDKVYGGSTGSKTAEKRDINESIASLRDQLVTSPTVSPMEAAEGPAAAQKMITERVLGQYIQLRSVLSVQQARPILASLAAICEGLRPIPSRKTLVMFSQGFVAPQVLDWQVQSTIDLANRANVAIYIIDSSGLTGGTPPSGALVPSSGLAAISAATSQESRIRAGGGESVFDISRQEGLNRQQDLLYRISGDTGGQFIKNTNDITKGLDRIDEEIRSRYTLAYHSTDSNFDGSFRKVKIEVSRPDAHLTSRSGYYAISSNDIVSLSPEDRKLLASVATANSNSGLSLFVELPSFRIIGGNYIVPLSIEISPNAVKFDKKGDKQLMQLEILGVIRATKDKILSRLGANFNVSLTAEQYQSIVNNNIFYRQDMELSPGTYSLDLIVRDKLSGKVAARREQLVLPVADSEFSATEVVLSRHVEPVKQSLAVNATTQTDDVFNLGSARIRPLPSREFHVTDNLILFLNMYNATTAADSGKPLVRVTVKLEKDGRVLAGPIDYKLTEIRPEPAPHLTFSKYIALSGMPTGKYTAEIEIRDMVSQKLLKQQTSFVILP